jgi:hypothetical protein
MVHHGQALVDPSLITIMIHTTLCVFNEHMLVVIINPFSSFSLGEILLVFMMLTIYNHIGHNVCLSNGLLQYTHNTFFLFHT